MKKERTYLVAEGKIVRSEDQDKERFTPKVQITRMGETGKVYGEFRHVGTNRNTEEKAKVVLDRMMDVLALPTPQSVVSKCADIDVDEEEDIDYDAAADGLLNWETEESSGVEVFDGFNIHDLSDFADLAPGTIHHLINHIEGQQLQDEAPWSIVYHLWKCLEAKGVGS